eukprot:7457328-Pyramimonas_sp.AAC.1
MPLGGFFGASSGFFWDLSGPFGGVLGRYCAGWPLWGRSRGPRAAAWGPSSGYIGGLLDRFGGFFVPFLEVS